MIPNVVKGSDMGGLTRYLVGRGRSNEHTNPHVIGGDGFVQAWHGSAELDQAAAAELAAYLDGPRLTYGTEIRTRVHQQNPETGAREPVLDEHGQQVWKDVHVWHCSLSIPAEDGPLSEETWQAITSDFMDEMGFTEASGKAPARWVAIHHGTSKAGNDHVHIAASMVRTDGTRWDGRLRDYPRSQQVCRELEIKYDLTPVDGRQRETAMPAPSRVEFEKAARAGQGQPARVELADRLRAAAVASTSEAEWIRRVRNNGVVIKPRFANGTTDVVVGYRAALKGTDRLDFYGGGQIGRDLSLNRVRENWAEPTLEASAEASAEWQAAFKSTRTGVQGREAAEMGTRTPGVAAHNLAFFRDKLENTPISDRKAWADAARGASGALSAWAQHDPANRADLQAAAAVLARTAQQRRAGVANATSGKVSPMGTAAILLAATRDDRGKLQAEVLMAQLIKTATAIAAYHRASGNQREAQRVHQDAVQRLRAVDLTNYIERQLAGVTRTAQRPLGSPLPSQLTTRQHEAARATDGGRDAGR